MRNVYFILLIFALMLFVFGCVNKGSGITKYGCCDVSKINNGKCKLSGDLPKGSPTEANILCCNITSDPSTYSCNAPAGYCNATIKTNEGAKNVLIKQCGSVVSGCDVGNCSAFVCGDFRYSPKLFSLNFIAPEKITGDLDSIKKSKKPLVSPMTFTSNLVGLLGKECKFFERKDLSKLFGNVKSASVDIFRVGFGKDYNDYFNYATVFPYTDRYIAVGMISPNRRDRYISYLYSPEELFSKQINFNPTPEEKEEYKKELIKKYFDVSNNPWGDYKVGNLYVNDWNASEPKPFECSNDGECYSGKCSKDVWFRGVCYRENNDSKPCGCDKTTMTCSLDPNEVSSDDFITVLNCDGYGKAMPLEFNGTYLKNELGIQEPSKEEFDERFPKGVVFLGRRVRVPVGYYFQDAIRAAIYANNEISNVVPVVNNDPQGRFTDIWFKKINDDCYSFQKIDDNDDIKYLDNVIAFSLDFPLDTEIYRACNLKEDKDYIRARGDEIMWPSPKLCGLFTSYCSVEYHDGNPKFVCSEHGEKPFIEPGNCDTDNYEEVYSSSFLIPQISYLFTLINENGDDSIILTDYNFLPKTKPLCAEYSSSFVGNSLPLPFGTAGEDVPSLIYEDACERNELKFPVPGYDYIGIWKGKDTTWVAYDFTLYIAHNKTNEDGKVEWYLGDCKLDPSTYFPVSNSYGWCEPGSYLTYASGVFNNTPAHNDAVELKIYDWTMRSVKLNNITFVFDGALMVDTGSSSCTYMGREFGGLYALGQPPENVPYVFSDNANVYSKYNMNMLGPFSSSYLILGPKLEGLFVNAVYDEDGTKYFVYYTCPFTNINPKDLDEDERCTDNWVFKDNALYCVSTHGNLLRYVPMPEGNSYAGSFGEKSVYLLSRNVIPVMSFSKGDKVMIGGLGSTCIDNAISDCSAAIKNVFNCYKNKDDKTQCTDLKDDMLKCVKDHIKKSDYCISPNVYSLLTPQEKFSIQSNPVVVVVDRSIYDYGDVKEHNIIYEKLAKPFGDKGVSISISDLKFDVLDRYVVKPFKKYSPNTMLAFAYNNFDNAIKRNPKYEDKGNDVYKYNASFILVDLNLSDVADNVGWFNDIDDIDKLKAMSNTEKIKMLEGISGKIFNYVINKSAILFNNTGKPIILRLHISHTGLFSTKDEKVSALASAMHPITYVLEYFLKRRSALVSYGISGVIIIPPDFKEDTLRYISEGTKYAYLLGSPSVQYKRVSVESSDWKNNPKNYPLCNDSKFNGYKINCSIMDEEGMFVGVRNVDFADLSNAPDKEFIISSLPDKFKCYLEDNDGFRYTFKKTVLVSGGTTPLYMDIGGNNRKPSAGSSCGGTNKVPTKQVCDIQSSTYFYTCNVLSNTGNIIPKGV